MRFAGLLLWLLVITTTAHADMKITRLRCEYLENPLDIDSLRPRLSWEVESSERGQLQTAYQVLVASSAESIRANRGDVWDSGKIASSQNAHIEVKGNPLQSAKPYWWKVRVWDKAGKPSRYSKVQHWEMGLLNPEEWHGKWIGRTLEQKYSPAPLLRRTFQTQSAVRRARIYVSGLGYYELSLNGKKVGTGHLDPGYTRFDRRVLYNVYDVTKSLQEGENALGAILGTGWLNVHTKAVWYFDKAPWRQSPRLLVELRLEYADGSTATVVSDEQWKTAESPIRFDSIYGGETYDARKELVGWNAPGYDESRWQSALVLSAPGGILKSAQMPPVRITQTLAPKTITQPKPGVYVFDIGQNLTGHALLTLSGKAGTTVKLEYGERLKPDGTLDVEHLSQFVRQAAPNQQFQTDTYTLKGEGVESFEARFCYHGFQYVQVTGFPGTPTKANLQARFAHTDVAPIGEFSCSNPLLNRLFRATQWSYLSNLQSIPTDCPHREKNGWTGDAHLAAEQALFNFDAAPVYAKWINDLDDEMRPSGELPGIVPSSGWGYEWGNGPAWDSAFLLIPWYMYEYLGDVRILENHYPKMRQYVDYLTKRSEGSIVTIGLGDWVPFKTETDVAVTSTAFYYIDTLILAKAAGVLGNAKDNAKYLAQAKQIKQAFLAKFYDPKTGKIANGGQTAQSCALYYGLTNDENRSPILKQLLGEVERNNGHIDTGILGAKYVLHSLLDQDRVDVAYQIASQKTLPSWGYWLEQGGTTLWESWGGTDSRNHIMFGDIIAWCYKAIAGIVPEVEHPGFAHFTIKPHPVGDLTSAQATYHSIRGVIRSTWKRDGERFTLEVTIPVHATARICVPAKSFASVQEGGKPLAANSSLTKPRFKNGYAVLEVESGKYIFTSELEAQKTP